MAVSPVCSPASFFFDTSPYRVSVTIHLPSRSRIPHFTPSLFDVFGLPSPPSPPLAALRIDLVSYCLESSWSPRCTVGQMPKCHSLASLLRLVLPWPATPPPFFISSPFVSHRIDSCFHDSNLALFLFCLPLTTHRPLPAACRLCATVAVLFCEPLFNPPPPPTLRPPMDLSTPTSPPIYLTRLHPPLIHDPGLQPISRSLCLATSFPHLLPPPFTLRSSPATDSYVWAFCRAP